MRRSDDSAGRLAFSLVCLTLRLACPPRSLTQAAAAKRLGATQPRLNQLLKGKIEIFSLDALVNMATSAEMRVGLGIRPKTRFPYSIEYN